MSTFVAAWRLRRDPLRFLSELAHEAPLARRVVGRRQLVVATAQDAAREVLEAGPAGEQPIAWLEGRVILGELVRRAVSLARSRS